MRVDLHTLARSMLVRAPRLFDLASGPARFRLQARMGRVAEAEFRALPRLTGKADPLVLDVGANVGQSIYSILTVLPRAQVVSFEPNPALHDLLRRVVASQPNVRLETVGLGSEPSSGTLFTPVYNGHAFPGLSSFDREAAQGWLTRSTLYGFDPARLVVQEATAVIRTLDEYALSPDVVKIDVQGMEADVIEGGLETIRSSRPAIIAETVRPDSRSMQLLEPLGYSLMEWRDGELVRATGACVNQILVPGAPR
ncbi:MAG TPA: FkbM family methyltransferase [Acidimicrobiales bacterium]|nr:FkbM family methyltransferase [Acidimicrobiales bacterium]